VSAKALGRAIGGVAGNGLPGLANPNQSRVTVRASGKNWPQLLPGDSRCAMRSWDRVLEHLYAIHSV
jgi:hypothetical protein